MVRQMRTVSVCSPTSVNSWLPKVESVLSRPVISTASYTAVPSGGRKAVAAVRGVPNPTVFHANAAPPISAPSRANTTRGGHHGRSGRGGAQDGSTSVCASGSSGSVLQSCTGNGDHGWSSARDTGTSCQTERGDDPPADRRPLGGRVAATHVYVGCGRMLEQLGPDAGAVAAGRWSSWGRMLEQLRPECRSS